MHKVKNVKNVEIPSSRNGKKFQEIIHLPTHKTMDMYVHHYTEQRSYRRQTARGIEKSKLIMHKLYVSAEVHSGK